MTTVPTALRFSRAELLFSVKAFAAAMLAMYVASRMGQPRPFWALMTAYIVASPLAGAVRSKALFRFLGTLLGCTAAVVLVPALSNAPVLLTLALALWLGLCLYFSLQDRTPRSYVFMLAGYTASLIGFPSVDTPLAMFDTAVARVQEIGVGIMAASLVHGIVLPQSLRAPVLGLLDRSLRDARQWLLHLVRPGTGALPLDRQRLAADITQLRLLSTHIPFDPSLLRAAAAPLRAVQDHAAALTPPLAAVEDRLQALQEAEGELAPDVVAVLARFARWLEALDGAGTDADATALRDDLRTFGSATAAMGWPRALRLSLAERLAELVDGWRTCAALRIDVERGLDGHPQAAVWPAPLGDHVLHRDRGMALLSSAAAVLAVCLCAAFWILTGWPSGSVAVMMAAVFCSFFATMDDPVPAIHGFLTYTLWSIPLSALYVLVLLPLVRDFTSLVLVCAPVCLVLGAFVARPSTTPAALPMLFGVMTTLAMHDTAAADLTSFTNATLAQVFGVVVASRTTRLMRSIGADWGARRIQRATWHDLADIAAAPRVPQAARAYAVRWLDRIALLAPRVAQAGGRLDGLPAEALRDLRLGSDVLTLQRVRWHLPLGPTTGLLTALARRLRGRASGARSGGDGSEAGMLLARLDDTLAASLAAHHPGAPELAAGIGALVGLRRSLFPDAAVPLRPACHPSAASEGAST